MTNRIVVTPDNNLLLRPAGPPGPPGFGSASDGGTGNPQDSPNEMDAAHLYIDGDVDSSAATIISSPSAYPSGFLVAFSNLGELSGIYTGSTEAGADEEDYGLLVKLRELPSKYIFAQSVKNSVGDEVEGPWTIVRMPSPGSLDPEWVTPQSMGAIGTATGVYIIDLRGAPTSDLPTGYSGTEPELYTPTPFEGFNLASIRYFNVDFSLLPNSAAHLVLVIPSGRYGIQVSQFPPIDRGDWTLSLVFEEGLIQGSYTFLGVTDDEVATFGFPPVSSDVSVTYEKGLAY